MDNKLPFIFLLILALCISRLHSQYSVKGSVQDADTNLPLAFVNIGVVNKEIGTVSAEDGSFYLSYKEGLLTPSDTLRVSSLGYEPYQVSVGTFLGQKDSFLGISLETEAIALDEVVLSGSKKDYRNKKDKIVGYTYAGILKNGTWEGDGALGGELVTKINVSKKKRQLNAFYFHVLENRSDSLLVRINVYDGRTKFPEKKLTNKNIVYTLSTKVGRVGVDLVPYGIVVEDDFSIGIELLKVYGAEIGLKLAGDDTPGVSYRRYTSQGEWKRYPNDALTYFVSATLLEEGEEDALTGATSIADYSNGQLLQTMGNNREVVNGYVFKEGEPLRNAQIHNLNSGEVTATDEKGRYTLKAKVNDELEFSYSFLQAEVRKVLETTFAINVSLEEKVVELEEVTVTTTARPKRSQKELYEQYNEDRDIIKTSFGYLDKNRTGYSIKILDESDLNAGMISLSAALYGKVSGLTMSSNVFNDPVIYLRQQGTGKPIPAAYEIDGLIVQGYPDFLDVSQIKRIAIMPGMAAVAKYGSVGAGGVIIINTKAANYMPPPTGSTIKVKSYTQEMDANAITEEEARRNWPDFLQELYGSQNFMEAQNSYNSYEPKYGSNPNFNIDACNYFLEFWKNEAFTSQLVADNLNRFQKDVTYLKSLAFILDKNGKYEQSVKLYKQILLLRSNSAESYRDLANAYIKNKQEDRGKNLYARYFYLLNDGFFSKQPEAIQDVINSEVKALLEIADDQVNNSLPNFIAQDNIRTRILLEWNDDAAELRFQFISPDKSVSSWSNTEDGELKESLLSKGYTSKDFFIYGNQGTWQINANYLGNQTGLATYLKVTVSTAYGTKKQIDRTEIFRMDVKNVDRKLLQIP